MSNSPQLAFVGGGNMAGALIGGLIKAGHAAQRILVIEPQEAQRERLARQWGLDPVESPDARLLGCQAVVWAVKPQQFGQAARACHGFVGGALHLSVMAGVRCGAIMRACGAQRVVRAMPNTPALIGRGIAGVYAQPEVSEDERKFVQELLAVSGQVLWVDREEQLDAVTALSGSGPAYVFYFIEAMMKAAVEMGLSEAQGRRLAEATFDGAAALSSQSTLHPSELRQQVTSKGGTTHAAIGALDDQAVKDAFIKALHAARVRAQELGDQFGG